MKKTRIVKIVVKKDVEPQGDVGEAINIARDIIRRREGLILVLTGGERAQKEMENRCIETLIAAAQEAAGLAMQLKNSEKIFGRIPFWQIDEEILGQIKRNTEALAAYRGAK